MLNDKAQDVIKDLARAVAKQTGETVSVTISGEAWSFKVEATCVDLAPLIISLECDPVGGWQL